MINSWNKVTLEQYVELYELLINFSSDSDNLLDIYSIILDQSIEQIRDMPYDLYLKIEKEILFVTKPVPDQVKEFITVNEAEFKLIEFNQLEFGAFIDLEAFLATKGGYINKLNCIFALLYRKIVKPAQEFTEIELESYSFDLNRRALMYDSIIITELYGALLAYMKYRAKLLASYQGLFVEKEDINDEDLSDLTNKERKEIEALQKSSRWSWQLLLFKLANNDPLRIMDAAKLNIVTAFNMLAMMQELKIEAKK